MNKSFIQNIRSFAVNEDGVSINNSVDTKVHSHKVIIIANDIEHEFLVNDVDEVSAQNKAIDSFREV